LSRRAFPKTKEGVTIIKRVSFSHVGVKNRALKVDTEMGYKWHVSPPPALRYKGDKTEITWEGKNLKAFEAYRFEW